MKRKVARFLFLLFAVGRALDAAPAGRPLVALPPVLQPGVSVSFTSVATGATDTRHDRMLALAVPAATPPSSRLSAGPFRAVLESELSMPLRTDVTFSFEGNGSAELTVNGRVVLTETGPALGTKAAAAVTLSQGVNRLSIVYSSPAAGDATFRLIWSGKDFGREPLPPDLLKSDVLAMPLRIAERLREGRELFVTLNCASCHALPGNEMPPELRNRPPSLEAAGSRFRESWIAAWILDPKAHRPDTTMPRVSLASPQDANDIAAYLASSGAPGAAAAPPATALVNGGGRLFAELRCIACHPAPGTALAADDRRVTLADVPAKWQPAALTAYLQDPRKNYPATRMPDFRLNAVEARQLAAFLLAGATPATAAIGGNPERGASLYLDVRVGCFDCHRGASEFNSVSRLIPTSRALAVVLQGGGATGCLGPTPAARGAAPDFGLTDTQRDSLRAFLGSGVTSLQQDAPVEFARRNFDALRCNACHARDGQPAMYDRFAGEAQALLKRYGASAEAEGENTSLDQDPPALTWAGEKLRPIWLLHQLAGDLPVAARPWLKARMPSFKAVAEGLAAGLALEHGLLVAETKPVVADPDQATLGERLASPEVFGCTACHAVGATPALAPFGAPGINFALVPSRLRDDYYRRWLDNPPRIEPRTKMPKFTSEPGRSLQTGILDGDAHAQWDALLAFLRTIAETEGPSLPTK